MSPTLEELGIDRLTPRERLELIERIWDRLPDAVTADEVPAWHLDELARRRARAAANPGQGKPWREALARFGADTNVGLKHSPSSVAGLCEAGA